MSIKLVVVDDAPFIREVIRHICSDSEVEIIGEASNGQEAVEVVTQQQPDVVLMDIVMPQKSGIEATQEILKKNASVRIVACSTVDQNTMVLRALDAGCCDYLTKPFKSEDVLRVIRKAASQKPSEEKSP
jgi:two-component system chemotaxis response regulator CheY